MHLSPLTPLAFLERSAAVFPEAIAVVDGDRSLTWAEQREWEAMEAAILGAESTVASLAAAATDPTIASNAAELAARCRALDDAQRAVDRLYARWAELEVKRG